MVYSNHVTTSARHSEINDMKLGQYWTRSGRSVDAAGRFLPCVDTNRTLAPGTLESGSRPEQVWTRP